MKKCSKILAALVLLMSILMPSPVHAAGRDEKIVALKNAGVINGYPDGSLGLDKPISRAEVSVLLIRMTSNAVNGPGAQMFKDVPSSHWASGYVQTACNLTNPEGISTIVGYPDSSFRPGNSVTNAEVMKMLTVVAKKDLTPSEVKNSTWPTSWINWAGELGIVGSGSGVGALNAKAPATRGDVFVMLYNANQGTVPAGGTGEYRPVSEQPKVAPIRKAPQPAKLVENNVDEFAAFNSGKSFDQEKFNREFLALINADRTKQGLVPLKWCNDFTNGACIRADELVTNGSINVNGKSHVRLDGSSWDTAFNDIQPKLRTTICGENLAEIVHMSGQKIGNKSRLFMSDEKVLAEAFYKLWWDSPGHRANMMQPKYRYINVQVRVGDHAKRGKSDKNVVYFVGTSYFRGDFK